MKVIIIKGNEECFIGLPLEQEHRMARMSPAGVMELLSYMFSSYKQFIMTLRIFFFPVPLFKTIFGNPAFMLGHVSDFEENNKIVHFRIATDLIVQTFTDWKYRQQMVRVQQEDWHNHLMVLSWGMC